ncbi:MAG: hypothetical protein EPN86_02685, partial [Nanoarchaeota archaeon]
VMLFTYLHGAFSYPYLEDDDAWAHATSVKYVQTQKTVLEPNNTYDKAFDVGAFQYIDPYPPAYDALIGVMSQVEGKVNWSLKFFNSLIISLSYLFFYFFATHFLGSNKKAFLSTFILAAVPAYLSHFIWAISLSLPLFFIALFALEKMKKNHSWIIPAVISVAAGLVVTPTHSIYFAIFIGIYLAGRVIAERSIHLKVFLACIAGGVLSALLWWLPMLLRYKSLHELASRIGFQSLSGTGDRAYSIVDFVIARNQNMINAPIGLGIFVFLLAGLGIILVFLRGKHIFQKENGWMVITLGWLLLAIYTVNSAGLPIRLSPFRTWVLLAIPVAILAGYAWSWLMDSKGNFFWIALVALAVIFIGYNQFAASINSSLGFQSLPAIDALLGIILIPLLFGFGYIGSIAIKSVGISVKRIPVIIFLVLAVAILITSFLPKYSLNNALWSPGGSFIYGDQFNQLEFQGYMSLLQLPADSRVFSLTYRHAANIIGLDHFTCNYCQVDIEMREKTGNVSTSELHDWLKSNKYDYVILDADYGLKYGAENAKNRATEMLNSGKFTVVKNNDNFVLFRVL